MKHQKHNVVKVDPPVVVVAPGVGGVPSISDESFVIDMAVEQFARENDIKESSLQVYTRNLKLFFDWVNHTGRALKYLSVADVIAWKNDLFESGKTSLTIAGYLTALRKFYSWIENKGIGHNITRGVKTPKRVQQFRKAALKATEAAMLLNHFEPEVEQQPGADVPTWKPTRRNFAIVNLMLRTGLRCIEVVRANVGDITIKDGRRVLYVHGKGRDEKDHFVMLTNKAYEPIKAYLETRRGALMNEPLFPSESHRNTGRRLTTRSISWMCKEGLRAQFGEDCKPYTAHSLRHTAAVMVLTHGGKLEDCQEVLRHANPATTQIYLNSIREERRLKRFAESRIDKAF